MTLAFSASELYCIRAAFEISDFEDLEHVYNT